MAPKRKRPFDAQVDAAAPHHGLEVALELIRLFIMPARLELREIHLARTAEQIEILQFEIQRRGDRLFDFRVLIELARQTLRLVDAN